MNSGEFADCTIVFDLDGTLVDTAPDLVRALNETLDLEGLPRAPFALVRRMVGQGARVLIERGAALSKVEFSDARLDELTSHFVRCYRADIARDSRPFPGVMEALDALAAGGATLAVCTNKRTDLSVELLESLGLAAYFSAIVGADAVAERKPHPGHYRAAVERAGGATEKSVMIGDTAADADAARGAGAPVALVRFGYCDVDVETLGADAVIDHYQELADTCRRLLAAAR